MRTISRFATAALVTLLAAPCVAADPPTPPRRPRPPAPLTLPAGYWGVDRTGPLLEKTQEVRLAPDLGHLTPGERRAVDRLLEVGALFQRIYEDSRHHQARSALRELEAVDKRLGNEATKNLLRLYRLNQGPIATTLENAREAFLPVDPVAPGKNVYPRGVTRKDLDEWLAAHEDERAAVLHPRTVVRRRDAASLRADVATLKRVPVLDVLHTGLRRRLEAMTPGPGFYALPYAVAWADDMVRAHELLQEAADAVEHDDADFALYLRQRSRDLLTNDYEAGDAAWVMGRFRRLNAQIGAFETYDDELFGVKAFHSLSIVLRDDKASTDVEGAVKGLQALEDSLTFTHHKRVREDIPVGVYDVVADFGQARGGNTASILPNEARQVRRYGRTIIMRSNIIRHPDLFGRAASTWELVMAPALAKDFNSDGSLQRTLWHEIGHYLGVDADRQGRELDVALEDNADLLEEMKADLVAVYVVRALQARGYYAPGAARAVYAAGIRRVLNEVRPRRDQPYQTMQLMQMNWFLDKGLLQWNPADQTLGIRYELYHEVVGTLLKEVLSLQFEADRAAVDRFIDRYTRWDPELHEKIAAKIRAGQRYRWQLMRYQALGE